MKKNIVSILYACLTAAVFAEANDSNPNESKLDKSPASGIRVRTASRTPNPLFKDFQNLPHKNAEAEFRTRISFQNALERYALLLSVKDRVPEAAQNHYKGRLLLAWKSLLRCDKAYREAKSKVTQKERDDAKEYLAGEVAFENFMATVYFDPATKSNFVERASALLEVERVHGQEIAAKAAAETPKLLERWRVAMEAYKSSHEGKMPKSLADLKESTPNAEGLEYVDGWGNEILLVLDSRGGYSIRSGGPDGAMTTSDDISVGNAMRNQREDFAAQLKVEKAQRDVVLTRRREEAGQLLKAHEQDVCVKLLALKEKIKDESQAVQAAYKERFEFHLDMYQSGTSKRFPTVHNKGEAKRRLDELLRGVQLDGNEKGKLVEELCNCTTTSETQNKTEEAQ